MLKRLLTVAVALLAGQAATAFAQSPLPRLKVEGQRIVDASGNSVTLRGVNLGNWLLIEPGVFAKAIGEFPDQYTLFKVLRDRFGEPERRRLIDTYRDHFITGRDFDNVKKFGFNLVRVGFDYELLEDDDRPMQLRADAFKYLDFAVKEAKARGIYVLFDLHGAQERAVSGKQGGHEGYSKFWQDPVARERSIWMWKKIAERYKGDTTVLGYEQLNEPFSAKTDELKAYTLQWYTAIREVDADAIAVIHGHYDNRGGISFYGKPADNGWTNVMFDMHFYPGSFAKPTATQPITPDVNTRFFEKTLPRWVKQMNDFNAPLLVGEMNVVYKEAGGGEMTRRYYDFFAEHGWPVTLWTLKELSPAGGYQGRFWMLTTKAGPIPATDIRKSPKADIEAVFKSLSTMPLMIDEDTHYWLTTNQKPSPLKPIENTPNTTGPSGDQASATSQPVS